MSAVGADTGGHHQGHPAGGSVHSGVRLAGDSAAVRGLRRGAAGAQSAQGVQEEPRTHRPAHLLSALLRRQREVVPVARSFHLSCSCPFVLVAVELIF